MIWWVISTSPCSWNLSLNQNFKNYPLYLFLKKGNKRWDWSSVFIPISDWNIGKRSMFLTFSWRRPLSYRNQSIDWSSVTKGFRKAWLYTKSITLRLGMSEKIFCEYFFVWFMKSLLHSFMNLDVNFYSFTNLENRSNLLLDSRHPCIPKWRTWFYPAARFSKYLTILERYAVNGLITFTVELIFRNCWMYIVSIKRK